MRGEGMDPAEPEDPGSLKNEDPGVVRGAASGPLPATGAGPSSTGAGAHKGGAPAGSSVKTAPDGNNPATKHPHTSDPHTSDPHTSDPHTSDPNGHDPPGKKPWSTRRKILTWTAGSLAVIVVIGVLGAYFVYRHLNGNLHQVDISGVLGSQPVDLHPQAQNILVLGSDTRHGQARRYGRASVRHTDHSDTLILLHFAADRQ